MRKDTAGEIRRKLRAVRREMSDVGVRRVSPSCCRTSHEWHFNTVLSRLEHQLRRANRKP